MKDQTHTLAPACAITRIFLLVMASLFLLYTGFDGYRSIVEAKFYLFTVLCIVYLGAMLLYPAGFTLTGRIRILNLKGRFFQRSWTRRFVLLYLTFTWISALASAYFPQTLVGMSRYEGALTITLYCIVFFTVSAFSRPDKLLLWVFAVSVALQNLLCMVQLTSANPFALYPGGTNYFGAGVDYGGAYLGTVGNVDLLASLYCIAIPVFLLGLCSLSGKLRFLLLFPLVSSVYVVVRMDVLSCFIGLGAGLVLTLPFALLCTPGTRKAVFAGIVCAGFAALGIIFFIDPGTGFLHEVHELLHGRAQDCFGSGRVYIWRNVLARVPEHLFFGTGPDTMVAGGIEPFMRWDENLGRMLVSNIDVAHSEYLNILYHQGIFALATYLAALIAAFRHWIGLSRWDAATGMYACAAACYAICALFDFSMCINAPFFWICLGLLDGQMVGRRTNENFVGWVPAAFRF